MGHDLRGQGLASAAGSREERADTQTSRAVSAKAPGFVDGSALAHVRNDFVQKLLLDLWQNEILPACSRLDALREVLQRRAGLQAADFPEQLPQFFAIFIYLSVLLQDLYAGGLDVRAAQFELHG